MNKADQKPSTRSIKNILQSSNGSLYVKMKCNKYNAKWEIRLPKEASKNLEVDGYSIFHLPEKNLKSIFQYIFDAVEEKNWKTLLNLQHSCHFFHKIIKTFFLQIFQSPLNCNNHLTKITNNFSVIDVNNIDFYKIKLLYAFATMHNQHCVKNGVVFPYIKFLKQYELFTAKTQLT